MESIGRYSAAIYRLCQSIFNYKLKEFEMKSGQYDFFLAILKNDGMTQKEISDILYVEKSTTAKAVKNLIDSGYIYKKQIENDKRSYSLYLTIKGKKASSKVETVFSEMLGIFSKNISEKVMEDSISVLKRVINNLDEEKRKNIKE
jgi:DNA-binding MarR family transcriptional regulator